MGETGNSKSYKFETDEETINYINSVEARLGMTHEEFVVACAEFVDDNETTFRRHSRGEARQ